jgi:hypothetical protein
LLELQNANRQQTTQFQEQAMAKFEQMLEAADYLKPNPVNMADLGDWSAFQSYRSSAERGERLYASQLDALRGEVPSVTDAAGIIAFVTEEMQERLASAVGTAVFTFLFVHFRGRTSSV